MEITNKEKGTLRLQYEENRPVMKMESGGVKMTFRFAESPPPKDAKQTVVDILTSQYVSKVSE